MGVGSGQGRGGVFDTETSLNYLFNSEVSQGEDWAA
jgi:hypothetical protein